MADYLNIISLALAIAALVPILIPRARVRFWTVSVGALSLIVLVTAWQFLVHHQQARAVDAAKNDVVRLLGQKRQMTFEQIYDGAFYRDFGVVNLALDDLVEEGSVGHDKLQVTDSSGAVYLIRVYSLAVRER